ncbi:MAG TPA: zinc-binding dehydrogenase [Terracidiphilus sp.]
MVYQPLKQAAPLVEHRCPVYWKNTSYSLKMVIGYVESSAATISLSSVLAPSGKLQGLSVGSRRHMSDLLAFMERQRIQPVIDATYDFNALPEALDRLDRGPFGKIVVELR